MEWLMAEWEGVISIVGFAVAYYGAKLGKTKWQRGLIWFVVLGVTLWMVKHEIWPNLFPPSG